MTVSSSIEICSEPLWGARHCLGKEFEAAAFCALCGLAGGLVCAEHGAPSDKIATRVTRRSLAERKMAKDREKQKRHGEFQRPVLLRLENAEVLILLALAEILILRMLLLELTR